MATEPTRTRRRKGRRTFGATRQLPSGRLQASYLAPDGSRRKAPETFPAAADANAWLTNVEKSIGAGTWRPPELAQRPSAITEPAGSPSGWISDHERLSSTHSHGASGSSPTSAA